jgi:D-beta-D-heptose 7-phosphate kinase/D-beta-D-heptose 1-phosphate adenosyltransferase
MEIRQKLKSNDVLARTLSSLRARGKKIVFTNGCFDILHVGHVRYLKKARSLGDVLVVALNSDASVRAIKGSGRPVNTERNRAEVLAGLWFVDYVTIFADPTPEKLIKKLKPDVLAKGADWKAGEIVGGDFVIANGGRVARIPFVRGHSTTSLIQKMRR